MIRREDGNDWLLISQVEHARVAAELAEVWGNDAIPPLTMSDLLVATIRHHDDGWHRWEQTIHPETGYPRDFLEMRMADATEFWKSSIEICAQIAPEAGVWVSRHFCWLGERAQRTRKSCAEDLKSTACFLAEQKGHQKRWTDVVQATKNGDLDKLFETGCHVIQFFDRVSLWLSCTAETEPAEIEMLGTGVFRLIPHSAFEVTIEPYPLSVDRIELSVPVRRLRARWYASDAEFHAALATAPVERLAWCIRR